MVKYDIFENSDLEDELNNYDTEKFKINRVLNFKKDDIINLKIRGCPYQIQPATIDLEKVYSNYNLNQKQIQCLGILYGLDVIYNDNSIIKNINYLELIRNSDIGNTIRFIRDESYTWECHSKYEGSNDYKIHYDIESGSKIGHYAQNLKLTYSNMLWMTIVLGYGEMYKKHVDKIPRSEVYNMVKDDCEDINDKIHREIASTLVRYCKLQLPNTDITSKDINNYVLKLILEKVN